MKKPITCILAVIALIALLLAGGENPDGSINLPWTLGCLAVSAACGYGVNRLDKKGGKK